MRSALHTLPDPETFPDQEEKFFASLLFQIGQQDRFAFEQLYRIWSPTLLGIAMRMLGDRQLAEEALQDTFVKVWHGATNYDPAKSKAFVWCFTILRSICIDRIRYQKRKKRDITKQTSWNTQSIPEPQMESQILAQDLAHVIRAALHQLPPDERHCLELAVFLEYTHSEISEQLHTPLGTVKNRLRRAMQKLHHLLSGHELFK